MASVIADVLKSNPGLIEKLVGFLFGLLRPKDKPKAAPEKPEGGNEEDDFPDDVIPAPKAAPVVTSVRLKLSRVQLSKQRFPNAYTMDNPFGLVNPAPIQAGSEAMNYGSKFWLDLTAYDEKGLEIMRDRVLANNLQYQTEHHCGEAFIIGKGGQNGEPNAGYETNDTNEIGNGNTAWRSSLGFLHQMKAHGQGTFECWGKVSGVESNHFTIRVS